MYREPGHIRRWRDRGGLHRGLPSEQAGQAELRMVEPLNAKRALGPHPNTRASFQEPSR